MKCGHAAMAIDGDNNPCCVICHGSPGANIIDDSPPDLTGRLAKCGCGNTRESSIGLAFFEYKGPTSYASKYMCKLCNYAIQAHWPRWEYQIRMVRDWFEHKRMQDDEKRTEHMPNKKYLEDYIKTRIAEMLSRPGIAFSSGEHKGKNATKIYEATLNYIKGPLPSGRGHDFVPHGPYKYDVFYCGCRGWD